MKLYVVIESSIPYGYEDSVDYKTNVFIGSSQEKADAFIDARVKAAGEKEEENQRAYLTRYYPEKAEAMIANLRKEKEKDTRRHLDVEISILDGEIQNGW